MIGKRADVQGHLVDGWKVAMKGHGGKGMCLHGEEGQRDRLSYFQAVSQYVSS